MSADAFVGSLVSAAAEISVVFVISEYEIMCDIADDHVVIFKCSSSGCC